MANHDDLVHALAISNVDKMLMGELLKEIYFTDFSQIGITTIIKQKIKTVLASNNIKLEFK